MKIKKRTKSSRYRGSFTHGRGFKKKARGKGHKGGKGMAGSGKKADQKKTIVLNLYGNNYFGKDRALRRKQKPKMPTINLGDIQDNFESFIEKGALKMKEKDSYTADFAGYKILSQGTWTHKVHFTAAAASKSAIDKVKKAGGDIVVK